MRNKQYVVWDQDTLQAKLQCIIDDKDTPKKVKDGPYPQYFLVIPTDEFSLGSENVSEFLRSAKFRKSSPLITHAYFHLRQPPPPRMPAWFKLDLNRRSLFERLTNTLRKLLARLRR